MTFSRRAILTLLGALGITTACSGAVPSPAPGTPPARRIAYGPDPAQFGMLHLPAGSGPRPIVVVVHGGYWQQEYGLDLGTPLAVDLSNHGFVAWNIEYRRLGGGGGWPATLTDVAAAVDALAGLAASTTQAALPASTASTAQLALDRVVLLGHSAGGQLAVWAASRDRLPAGSPGANPLVKPRGVVSQAGVLDLVAAADQHLGGDAAVGLLGGPPSAVPDRYAAASPLALAPAEVPVVCVHGSDDTTVPLDQSARYVSVASQRGRTARLRTVDGADHFTLIDPTTTAWAACRQEVQGLV